MPKINHILKNYIIFKQNCSFPRWGIKNILQGNPSKEADSQLSQAKLSVFRNHSEMNLSCAAQRYDEKEGAA